MSKKVKKLTKERALERVKRMASSYTGAGRPKVTKVPKKNEYKYVFPIKNRKGRTIAYGVGTIRPGGSSGTSISKLHVDLIRRKK